MTTEQIKNWLAEQTEIGEGIAVGTIDGDTDRFLGIYDDRTPGGQRVCVGGKNETKYQEKNVRILIHWSLSAVEAEHKARELYDLLYAQTNIQMDGVLVYSIDPGAAPIPVGRDARGIYEYVITLSLLYERKE